MAKPKKPFIVEIKPSRKLKSGNGKTSIWGTANLKPDETVETTAMPKDKPTPVAEVSHPD